MFQLRVDVLARPHQLAALQAVLGEALCAAPGDHDGPCRIAWSTHHVATMDDDVPGAGLTKEETADIRENLEPVAVWSQAAVDRSLGLLPSNGPG